MELLAVIALLSLMLFMGLPLIQSQYYARELEHTARQFIRHAQFARQHALYSGTHTAIRPREEGEDGWGLGWQIKVLTPYSADEMANSILVQYDLPANHLQSSWCG
ncbi:MAG: hypothetical protein RL082_1753 [Pseudomonadota bacterium]